MNIAEQILDIVKKNVIVNKEQLIKEIAFQVLLPELEKFVASTENPYDNMLIDALKKFIEKQ